MRKPRGRIAVSDAEIDAAIARGKAYQRVASRATSATYRNGHVVVTFAIGTQVSIPPQLLPGLETADARVIAQVELLGDDMLHWEALDLDHYIPAVLARMFALRDGEASLRRRAVSKRP